MRTRLDTLPTELRFNTQLRRQDSMVIDEGVIELLDELYTENGTYLPNALLEDDEKAYLKLLASKLQGLFHINTENGRAPTIECEAYYFPISVAQILTSRTLYPHISPVKSEPDKRISKEDRSQVLRAITERYLDNNPAVTGLIAAHLDQIGLDDIDASNRRPIPMIMAGYSFLAIETQNLKFYEDDMVLRRMEQDF